MTKPKRKPSNLAVHMAHATPGRERRAWNWAKYLQWAPVIIVAGGAFAGYIGQGYRITALENAKPATDLTETLTRLKDGIAVADANIVELKAKEAADYTEMKTNDQALWQFVGRRQESSKP